MLSARLFGLCRNTRLVSTRSNGSKVNTIANMKDRIEALGSNKEINTVPNMITFARILASPGLAYAIAHNMKAVALTTCVLFGFSDWLDGYLARKLNQKTVFGALLDPMADKIMIGSICGGLAYNGLIPLPLAGLIVGRDVALLACSFIIRARERPSGSPFFDTTYSATFSIIPSDLSKVCRAPVDDSSFVLIHMYFRLSLFIDKYSDAVLFAFCHSGSVRLWSSLDSGD